MSQMQVPSSVKSSQSKHLISAMLPPNMVSSSVATSARNSIINSSSQFRPNTDLKTHVLNMSSNNAKNIQSSAALKS